jgi:hypothetical protein
MYRSSQAKNCGGVGKGKKQYSKPIHGPASARCDVYRMQQVNLCYSNANRNRWCPPVHKCAEPLWVKVDRVKGEVPVLAHVVDVGPDGVQGNACRLVALHHTCHLLQVMVPPPAAQAGRCGRKQAEKQGTGTLTSQIDVLPWCWCVCETNTPLHAIAWSPAAWSAGCCMMT